MPPLSPCAPLAWAAFRRSPNGLVSLRFPHEVQPTLTFTPSSIVNVARGIEGYGTSTVRLPARFAAAIQRRGMAWSCVALMQESMCDSLAVATWSVNEYPRAASRFFFSTPAWCSSPSGAIGCLPASSILHGWRRYFAPYAPTLSVTLEEFNGGSRPFAGHIPAGSSLARARQRLKGASCRLLSQKFPAIATFWNAKSAGAIRWLGWRRSHPAAGAVHRGPEGGKTLSAPGPGVALAWWLELAPVAPRGPSGQWGGTIPPGSRRS